MAGLWHGAISRSVVSYLAGAEGRDVEAIGRALGDQPLLVADLKIVTATRVASDANVTGRIWQG